MKLYIGILYFRTECYTLLIQIKQLLSSTMEDKLILNEFAAKISKAKNMYDSTSANCEKLRRQVSQLQKQYEMVKSQREAAEIGEKHLKQQLQNAKNINKQQSDRLNKQGHHLQQLRKNKKQLKRQKDIIQNELLKHTLSLQQQIKQRQKLQVTAKTLSQKLEGVTVQKQTLVQQYNQTCLAIQKHNKNISILKQQISDMRSVIVSNSIRG